jgi:hypothetical protein
VDDGEALGLADKRAPILIADGVFDYEAVLERFLTIADGVPRDIADFVAGKLKEYSSKG